ncbi:Lytic transglycosylase domain-containing protein [Azospirillaceae bacterium]
MQDVTRQVKGMLSGVRIVLLGLGMLSVAAVTVAQSASAAEQNCSGHLIQVEQRLHIPSGLLLAIALVESGQDGEPQPYAISVGNRSHFAQDAHGALRLIQDRNGGMRSNVYVGCMQLSLTHHHKNFKPVERIVDPEANVLYAGKLLVRLHGEVGTWKAAVARYNGASPQHAQAYLCRVWQHLVEFDWKSARMLESPRCQKTNVASIAPRTRRAFREAQVASTER